MHACMRAARTGWQAALRRAHADLAIGQRVIEDVELRDVALEVGVVLPVRAADVVLLAEAPFAAGAPVHAP